MLLTCILFYKIYPNTLNTITNLFEEASFSDIRDAFNSTM